MSPPPIVNALFGVSVPPWSGVASEAVASTAAPARALAGAACVTAPLVDPGAPPPPSRLNGDVGTGRLVYRDTSSDARPNVLTILRLRNTMNTNRSLHRRKRRPECDRAFHIPSDICDRGKHLGSLSVPPSTHPPPPPMDALPKTTSGVGGGGVRGGGVAATDIQRELASVAPLVCADEKLRVNGH